ncbi:hypothetical protein FF011L_53260 [Roseimaritima multifibrata]|uniref:Tetratricopeptide repeat protein n=1 Tax=Roseimaritima multifibrata TaxID=1930274 RepID=A0A517MNR2_9BACT|nr:tetratricopeptide repeat protein [Roseimaritima multifibrata]QDS96514.1 hypothetical protein FF011L_53260 [Roseimaritima multifibrata]
MNIKRIKLALLIAATASPVFASEEDTARQINAANTLVREGDFDNAIAEYQSATAASGDLKYRLDYNLGVAQYRKGEIAAAKEQFMQASASSDTPLAAAARYNLGNCFYADAVASAEQDKPAAIEALTQAIDHYRGSLSGDPNHTDARANIELAGQLLKKLQEEQQQQEQQQPQQEQQQDEQQQDKQEQDKQDQQQQDEQQQDQQEQDKQDQQQQDQQQKQEQSKQEQQDQQQQGQQDKQDQQQQDQQKNEGQPSEQDQSKQDQKGQQSEQEQADAEQQSQEDQASDGKPSKQEHAKPNESASDDAKPSEDATLGEENEEEAEQQEIPSGDLKPVGELDENQKPTGSVAMEDLNAEETPMSKEEALKMLQAVRDRDMLRRLRAEQIERRRHVPTDRDW